MTLQRYTPTSQSDSSYGGMKMGHHKKFSPQMYPITSVNKVAINPNEQAFLYHAIGYQSGFLKVNCARYLKDDL